MRISQNPFRKYIRNISLLIKSIMFIVITHYLGLTASCLKRDASIIASCATLYAICALLGFVQAWLNLMKFRPLIGSRRSGLYVNTITVGSKSSLWWNYAAPCSGDVCCTLPQDELNWTGLSAQLRNPTSTFVAVTLHSRPGDRLTSSQCHLSRQIMFHTPTNEKLFEISLDSKCDYVKNWVICAVSSEFVFQFRPVSGIWFKSIDFW